jgi:hypothetical protein
MRKIILTSIGFLVTFLSVAQGADNTKLIDIAKTYKDFMFRNEADKQVLKELKAGIPDDMAGAVDFIAQTISSKNKLLTTQYLSRPDDKTLKQIFVIRSVDLNLREENPVDNNRLIDSLSKANISVYELVDNYYAMLFTAVGNKNQPFDFSRVDLKLKEYGLKDDTERGIVFLRCMRLCNSVIWGYMNVPKPPNTQKALEHIRKYPQFNGRPYYQYTDFYFPDFDMEVLADEDKQSYKEYYLDKYFEVLLFHLICLNKEGGTEKEKNDLLLGSILKEKNLYKYTKYKKTLEDIFQEQK